MKPDMVQKKPPEQKPKKEPERDDLLDVLVYRAFDRAALRAIENDLPIEEHWREVIAQIEKLLDGTVKTIRKHPDTELHYLQIAATIATDAIPKKKKWPRRTVTRARPMNKKSIFIVIKARRNVKC